VASLLLACLLGAQGLPDTVAVCPSEFREALQPWIALRARQGHELAVVSSTGSPEDIQGRIREAARGGRLRFVVLVGDAWPTVALRFSPPGADDVIGVDAGLRPRCVPVHRARAKVNALWGSEPHLATDNWYADLNDDQVPDLAIGRLTADSPEELSAIISKILVYEQSSDFGLWRQRLNFVAGLGGFGAIADAVLESATRYFLTQGIPAGYRTTMTYGNWRSPFCPDPRLFRLTALERLNEGSWFWVYIGHGYHLGLDRIHTPAGDYPILDASDVADLKSEHGFPIALFLACYTGAIDAREDCLAERMLAAPGGPVAVLAGSRVTMPYGMSVMAKELLDECFRRRTATLGEALLHAKQAMVRPPAADDQQRAMLDTIAGALSPTKELAAERAEHVLLMNLIGDPLLRLRHPQPVELDLPVEGAAGNRLLVRGRTAVDGLGTAELRMPRGRLRVKCLDRRQYPQTSGQLAALHEEYQVANDGGLASARFAVAQGRFEIQLEVPADAWGACHVSVFVEGRDDCALGAAEVRIVRDAEGQDRLSTRSPGAAISR